MYFSTSSIFPSGSDVDTIVTLCVRSLEDADQTTRHSLAQLVAQMLASTQVERKVSIPEPAQKAKKDQDDMDAGLSSAVSAAADVTKPLLTPADMLGHLSNHFNKPNASRKTRIGIFDFYAALLARLGSSFVESNFSLIVAHLMLEIVNNPRNSTRYEALLVRSLVGILLRDLIGVRMLSEQGQISAIQELVTAYLKRWPAVMPGQVAPSSLMLVIVLREVAGLLQQLGNSPPPVQVRPLFRNAVGLLLMLSRMLLENLSLRFSGTQVIQHVSLLRGLCAAFAIPPLSSSPRLSLQSQSFFNATSHLSFPPLHPPTSNHGH